MKGSRIVLVEDDAPARELLAQFLSRYGLSVSALESGERALDVLSREAASLLLLDLELPGECGLSVCRRLRASGSRVPVIMVTGRGEIVDRVLGLEMGADDYLVKPFDPRELLARIGLQLRRQAQRSEPSSPARPPLQCRFGPFQLDTGQRTLTRCGAVIVMSRGEFALLDVFARHPNEPLSRESLYKLINRHGFVTSDRSVDVRIARLRRLIEDDVSHPRYIRTLWGVGYVFTPDENEE